MGVVESTARSEIKPRSAVETSAVAGQGALCERLIDAGKLEPGNAERALRLLREQEGNPR